MACARITRARRHQQPSCSSAATERRRAGAAERRFVMTRAEVPDRTAARTLPPLYGDRRHWALIEADALALLGQLPPNSIDAVVTDPPYGLAFNGEHWDGGSLADGHGFQAFTAGGRRDSCASSSPAATSRPSAHPHRPPPGAGIRGRRLRGPRSAAVVLRQRRAEVPANGAAAWAQASSPPTSRSCWRASRWIRRRRRSPPTSRGTAPAR